MIQPVYPRGNMRSSNFNVSCAIGNGRPVRMNLLQVCSGIKLHARDIDACKKTGQILYGGELKLRVNL
jgi:hypothetical protein